MEQQSLLASLPRCAQKQALAMKGTAQREAKWHLEVWKIPFSPLGTNPGYSPCIMQCCLENTADAGDGTCHAWQQTLTQCPAGCPTLGTDTGTDTQTDGQQPPHTPEAGLALGGTSPSRNSPVPTGRELGAHRGHRAVGTPWAHCGTHSASRESKMTWNTNGFVPFQTKLLF